MSNSEYRTYDGSNNNLDNVDWGKANTPLLRITTPNYADESSSLAIRGPRNPNPRDISNQICQQRRSSPNPNQLSDFMWAWGQFLDHEIDLTEHLEDETADIITPRNDPHLKGATIPFSRSLFDPSTGTGANNPRQQINQISAYIDASNVYGSSVERANALRAFDGTGRLKTSAADVGELLPYNVNGLENAAQPNMQASELYVAGDIRANENAVLACMHTLFVREHNRLCLDIVTCQPEMIGNDEAVFQRARTIVSGLMQSITYNEFLPALMGFNALSPYTGYKPNVNASVANVFSTAAYRLGHSMLSSAIRLGTEGRSLALRDTFFKPFLVNLYGIEPFLSGLSVQVMQDIDAQIIDDVRSFLFGPPNPERQQLLDLPALNIQRGRDHGLPGYNQCREDYNLVRFCDFSDVTKNERLQRRLKNLYKDVDHIDPWIGGLVEDHMKGGNIGEFIFTVLKDQFERLRDGDRFWYQNDPALSRERQIEIENTRLADVVRRNTTIRDISDNVFVVS
ncbi:MAG: peroxiredoxin [Gammaproteobacteria bacterium]|nr:peroxiredoxin [Gammaproteobacteria bacterium]